MSIQIVAPGKAATSSERAEEVIVEEENEDGHVTKVSEPTRSQSIVFMLFSRKKPIYFFLFCFVM